MTAAHIQAKIYKGYGKVAAKLGTNYQFYRPQGSNAPVASGVTLDEPGALLDTGLQLDVGSVQLDTGLQLDTGVLFNNTGAKTVVLPVSLNAQDWKYIKPNLYGKALWYAAFDATSVNVGDYFIGAQGIFFVATKQPMLTILAVECNRVISVLRPKAASGFGVASYGGNTVAEETPLLTGWPASILQGSRGENTEGKLPGDTRQPAWVVLLPSLAGVIINTADILTDDLNRRYVVNHAELSDLGWRVLAMQVVV